MSAEVLAELSSLCKSDAEVDAELFNSESDFCAADKLPDTDSLALLLSDPIRETVEVTSDVDSRPDAALDRLVEASETSLCT